ncbi:MAG: phosphoenolpyruvate synthase regulatory protein [Rhodobiaceae bacterium]|nr:phosphoenolpyruvate synthase regulatory protein [Rhodobiaceae bacterium]
MNKRSKKKLTIHLVSDSTGETLRSVGAAAAAQFSSAKYIERVYPLIRTQTQLERVFKKIKRGDGIVLCTLVDDKLRKGLEDFCGHEKIPYMPIMESIVSLIEGHLKEHAIKKPGGQHELNKEYFRRIEAINYTLEHDDGQGKETLNQAEIIIVGVSRTSKTPTCIYLANLGIKAANVPLLPGQDLPKEITKAKNSLVVSLIISPKSLVEIRQKRTKNLGLEEPKDQYTDLYNVEKEIENAKKIFSSRSWPIIDTTRRSVEETAAAILNIRSQGN